MGDKFQGGGCGKNKQYPLGITLAMALRKPNGLSTRARRGGGARAGMFGTGSREKEIQAKERKERKEGHFFFSSYNWVSFMVS